MKYYLLPNDEVQTGDVIFTNCGMDSGVQLCGRVIGETLPRKDPEITEWRVEIVVGTKEHPQGTFTTLEFRHDLKVGVAREDVFVDVDVAGILEDMERNKG